MLQSNLRIVLPQASAILYLCLNFGFQYIYVERFGYVVIGSFLQSFYDGCPEGLGGK